MPGFGQGPFGAAPFGQTAPTIPPRYALTPIAAKKYDPATKSYEVNVDGQYVGTHPVDQFVVHQCTLLDNSIRSAPSVGNPAQRITHLGSRFEETVRSLLLQRLAPKVSSGELRVHRVLVSKSDGRVLIGVDYTNLVTRSRKKVFGE